MRFTHNGIDYVIEFERKLRGHQALMRDEDGDLMFDEDGLPVKVEYPDHYPTTIVRLIQVPTELKGVVDAGRVVMLTDEVSCWRQDRPSN